MLIVISIALLAVITKDTKTFINECKIRPLPITSFYFCCVVIMQNGIHKKGEHPI